MTTNMITIIRTGMIIMTTTMIMGTITSIPAASDACSQR